jgi:beta-aspartyl-peptidase (threonine type)
MLPFSLVIHGGSGTILKENMTAELEAAYLQSLEEALMAGFGELEKGTSATEAVLAAVISLENNILFNAGRGSVFTKNGTHEMDAAIMDGKTLAAGAVASVRNIRNPVALAAKVMTESPHVFLCGKGAEEFAAIHDVQREPDEYFYSDFRYRQWQSVKDENIQALDHNILLTENKFGTVGAVACDRYGNLAAATSTGGMTNKQPGRIGDSPLIGIGTYANNKTCAISCTGHGEPFIKAVAAYDVSCLMEYKGFSLKEAMHCVVYDKLLRLGGEGGMIGVDASGNTAMIFNSTGMYRAVKNSHGLHFKAIYRDE